MTFTSGGGQVTAPAAFGGDCGTETARSTIGDRAFSVAAARAWKSLALSVAPSAALPVFRKHLKPAALLVCLFVA